MSANIAGRYGVLPAATALPAIASINQSGWTAAVKGRTILSLGWRISISAATASFTSPATFPLALGILMGAILIALSLPIFLARVSASLALACSSSSSEYSRMTSGTNPALTAMEHERNERGLCRLHNALPSEPYGSPPGPLLTFMQTYANFLPAKASITLLASCSLFAGCAPISASLATSLLEEENSTSLPA